MLKTHESTLLDTLVQLLVNTNISSKHHLSGGKYLFGNSKKEKKKKVCRTACGWSAAAAEDHTECSSCQLRAGI